MAIDDGTIPDAARRRPTPARGITRFRVAIAMTVALVAALAPGPQVLGAMPRAQLLTTTRQPVTFSGSVGQSSPSPAPDACSSAPCDRFDLTVDLPTGAWNHKSGGIEVSVRWHGLFDTLGLVVYRDGALLAEATAPFATAQSVRLPAAVSATYAVYVVYDAANSMSTSIDYEGLAEVEYDPRPNPSRVLLPDLTVRAQRNVTFDTPLAIFEPDPELGSSCLPTEVADGASTCLRFDLPVANAGEGALEVRLPIRKDGTTTAGTAFQRLYRSDGGTHVDRQAGPFEFHAAHEHFHYSAFALSRLWAADGRGRRAGAAPVRTSGKLSFCVVDIEIDAWGAKGNGPRQYGFPSCLIPTAGDGTYDHLVQGITPGWADIYDWFLPGQYVEVSGVPDGTYILDTVVDPDGTLTEADRSNNCASVVVRLSGMASATPTATLVGTGPAC